MNKRKTGMKIRKPSMKKLILLVTVLLTALVTALLTAHLLMPLVYDADIRLSSSCSLADAIIAANHDRPEGGCPAGRGADIIILTRDITLDGGLPKITSNITIEGEGYTISGDNRYRMFFNEGGALTIKDLTMTKGRVEGEPIRNADGALKATTANPIGSAILNSGQLSIVNSAFSDNAAEYGGAIHSQGELSISDSVFSRNSADEAGGAIFNGSELSISGSSFSGNSADAVGGAIFNGSELSITNSSFSDNSADTAGGAIATAGDGTLSISDSVFSRNSADEAGGAIFNLGELSISGSSFSGNSAEAGGAIGNGGDGELSISTSTFSGNLAESNGGAIYNWEELSITNSSFSENSTDAAGGAIYNDEGTLSITNSSFSDNLADEASGAIGNGGELSIVNSTFSGNSAEAGGAIGNGGELSIVNSTFSGNSAEHGGTIVNVEDGTLSMINSIIAVRGDENVCLSIGELKRNINNFIQDGTCSPAFKGDPMLGELVEPEDGSPAYFPLLAGSRAIDAAYDDLCLETDQIGTVRPQGAGCDIGAIEYVSP